MDKPYSASSVLIELVNPIIIEDDRTAPMRNYQHYIDEALPELYPGENLSAEDYLRQTANLEIAGFVLRQANVSHEYDRLPDTPLLVGATALGGCLTVFSSKMIGTIAIPDFGPHSDRALEDATSRCRVVNFHTTGAGSANVSIIMALPDVEDCSLPLPGVDQPADSEHDIRFANGQVDTDLFKPIRYKTTVHPGDTLVFLDYRTLHDFVTISGEIRTYTSGLYPYTIG